jgi:hypothetical protein
VVCSSGRVAYFEASANKAVEVDFPNNTSFVYHTNHPVVNDDYSPEGAQQMLNSNPADNTRTRYQALKNHLAGDPGKNVIDLIQETSGSHDSQLYPVCRRLFDKATSFTFASTIIVLEEHPYLLAAPGPPDQYEYTAFRFRAKAVTAAQWRRFGASVFVVSVQGRQGADPLADIHNKTKIAEVFLAGTRIRSCSNSIRR